MGRDSTVSERKLDRTCAACAPDGRRCAAAVGTGAAAVVPSAVAYLEYSVLSCAREGRVFGSSVIFRAHVTHHGKRNGGIPLVEERRAMQGRGWTPHPPLIVHSDCCLAPLATGMVPRWLGERGES